MEHYFDHQFQFFKQLDVKAQSKPLKRKRWLLSREYLQPLTEPDDEENSLEEQDEDTNRYKKKLKCAYEAAKYGMKEGVLTGVFLGGCWGIFKHLGENFHFGFSGSETTGDELKGQKSKSGNWSQKPTANTKKNFVSSNQTRSISTTNGNINQENISTHTESVSVVRDKFPEKNYYSAGTNQLIYSSTDSKLPIRNDKHLPPLRSGGMGFFENNKYSFRRSREKVEIVGYAFIQTTGSITGSGSDESNSQRNIRENTSKGEENSRKNSTDKSKTSATRPSIRSVSFQKTPQNSASNLKISDPEKDFYSSVKSPCRSVTKTIGSSIEKLVSSSAPIHSQLSAGEIEHSNSTYSDPVEEMQNDISVRQQSDMKTSTNESVSSSSKTDFPLPENRVKDESEILLSSSLSSWGYSKPESKGSSIATIKASESLPYNVENEPVMEMESVTKGKQLRKKNKTESHNFYNANQNKRGSENLYPDPKKVGGVLVDMDAISNGFTSPPPITQSAKSSYIKYTERQQSAPYASPKKSAAKMESEPESLKPTDSETSYSKMENHDMYTVETSPTFLRSFVSANKSEGRSVGSSVTNDTTHGSDSQNGRYIVESSPTYKGSHARVRNDVRKRESDSRSFISEAPVTDGKSSPYYKYQNSETLVYGRSPQSRSYMSETSESEKGSPLLDGKHIRNETPASGSLLYGKPYISKEYIAENGSPPTHKKRRSETFPLENHNMRVSYDSYNKTYPSESFAASGGNSSYYDSYVNEIEEKRKHSLESTSPNKSYASDRYSRDKLNYSSENSKGSRRYNLSETQEEKSFSSGFPTYDRSYDHKGTVDERVSLSSNPTHTKSYSSHLQGEAESSSVYKRTHSEAEDVRRRKSRTSDAFSFVSKQASARERSILEEPDYSAPQFQRSSHSYMKAERETSAGRTSVSLLQGVGLVSQTPPPRKVQPEKTAFAEDQEKTELDEPTKKEKSIRGFNFLSAVNENIIILSACNCAIVLGIVCSIISTTRASLAV